MATKHTPADAALMASDILHRPAEPRLPNEDGGTYGAGRFVVDAHGIAEPIEPTRADEREAADRAERGRDGARIRVPTPPPIATAESVRAELRGSRSAERMVASEPRLRDAGHGILEADETPRAETERALRPREPRETPRGVPDYIAADASGRVIQRFRQHRGGRGFNGR